LTQIKSPVDLHERLLHHWLHREMRMIDTNPKKGWFAILRLYSPLEPFFAKTWRPSEIALVR